ncbi:hypothetical protein [Mesorhizobium sp.]|uniref:hypothetical protein n=1 Tax=Mesorhizobium sp. TaxID=1871066 RepID=UPI00257F07BB|nr:hypothetical protein [Mesorhizobium sp.]
MKNLNDFEQGLEARVGRSTDMRPFVCNGSPLKCRVFIVGFNPATTMTASFWDFWQSGYGFDKKAWFDEYKKDRAARPLKPGKTRRNSVSNTRRVIDWITEAASPYDCLETNIYSLPSDDKNGLRQAGRDTTSFTFLLECIKPSVIVAHGEDAIREMLSLAPPAHVIPVKHFSRGWSQKAARALGEEIKSRMCEAGQQPLSSGFQLII